jgi:hypothetical protein
MSGFDLCLHIWFVEVQIMLRSVVCFAVFCVLAAPLRAQSCNWSNWDLRGGYTAAGTGWNDLSKDVDPNLPKGYSPSVLVQGFNWDGIGGGSGWISANLGGIQFDAEVKWTYAVQADCSIKGTHSFKILGVWGPQSPVVWVISDLGQGGLELKGIQRGTGPGSGVTTVTARRISRNL